MNTTQTPNQVGSEARPNAACPHLAQTQRLVRVDPAAVDNFGTGDFTRYVLDGAHPCVMARSLVNRKQVFMAHYGALGDPKNGAAVCHDLYEVLSASEAENSLLSMAAVFPGRAFATEQAFEEALWTQLNGMHEVDRQLFPWDPTVSRDPAHPTFSFSVGGAAWYVVGLHPRSSRTSRRFDTPTLIFNRHAQFEALRQQGRYDSLQERIRQRDVRLQGSVNPMLKDHGEASEAIQYSGRAIEDAWQCPFGAGHGPSGTGASARTN